MVCPPQKGVFLWCWAAQGTQVHPGPYIWFLRWLSLSDSRTLPGDRRPGEGPGSSFEPPFVPDSAFFPERAGGPEASLLGTFQALRLLLEGAALTVPELGACRASAAGGDRDSPPVTQHLWASFPRPPPAPAGLAASATPEQT